MTKITTILDGDCKSSENEQGPVKAVAMWGETPPRNYWQTSRNYALGKYQLLGIPELSVKGVGIRELAEMAGHASIQTTQRYIDVNDEQIGQAAELIRGKSC